MSRPSSISNRLTIRPAGPVCTVIRFMPSILASDFSGFVRRMRELYAAGFAAATGMNLRFDDDDI